MGAVPASGDLGQALARVLGHALREMDRWRRARGEWMQAAGQGAQPAPSRVHFAEDGVVLRAYGDGTGPPLLLVPAPIKRAYIWDLCPQASVVRRALEQGWRVFLLEWPEPGEADADSGLEAYACLMIGRCAEAIGRPAILGHSLGGTLAGLFAARHPERAAALVLIEAPLAFGPHAGAFGPYAAGDGESWRQAFPVVPGSLLNLASGLAAPETFALERQMDLLASLTDRAALALHRRVERWTLDELPMPGQLLGEILARLYREDRFMKADLILEGTTVSPAQLSMPLFSVGERDSRVVPAGGILALHEAAASRRKRLAWYVREQGVALQHVGPLVGPGAHRRLWPEILAWLRQIAGPRPSP